MATNGKTRDVTVRPSMLSELEDVGAEVRDAFRDVWGSRWPTFMRPRFSRLMREPALDMFERDNNIVVKAEMPGIAPEDIEVTVSDGELRISGQRKEEKEVKEEDFFRTERSYGKIFRSLALPEACDTESVQASIKDGVLEVVIPRKPQAAAKKIEVKAQA